MDVKCGYVRGSLFVKIYTNQGIWACGEAVDAIQDTYHMVRSFGQRLRNQSPLNLHRIFEQIRKGGIFGGAQSGVFIAVLLAVETALSDLAGKALNVPVYQLGQTHGAAEPDVAGRARAGGERRRLQAHSPGNQHSDLCRREHLPCPRLPALARDARREHRDADLQKAGGLGEGQRIANLANLYYVPFAPHMVASFLGPFRLRRTRVGHDQ
jgi:L-alanine-DL-glutamate epimerase-like enolase superfamily enzyme